MEKDKKLVLIIIGGLFMLTLILATMLTIQEKGHLNLCLKDNYSKVETVYEGFSRVGFQCYNYLYNNIGLRSKVYGKVHYYNQLTILGKLKEETIN